MDCQIELPILNGFSPNIADRLNKLETKLNLIEQKQKDRGCISPSEDSFAVYLLLKSNLCSPSLRECGSLLFGMRNKIYLAEYDGFKDFKVDGKVLHEDLKLLCNGKLSNLVFTFEFDKIPMNCNFNLYFNLNHDTNTGFGINFTKNIQFTYKQSSISKYKEFNGHFENLSKCDRTQYLQLRYNTRKEKFTDLLTCKALNDSNSTLHSGNFLSVSKNFIYDWIESTSRRIHIEKKSSDPYHIELRSFIITVI